MNAFLLLRSAAFSKEQYLIKLFILYIVIITSSCYGQGSSSPDTLLQPVKTSVTVSERLDNQISTASSATRTDTLLLDLPISVQAVSRKLIEDQQALGMNDVVRNVSGVTVPNSSGGRAEDVLMRGFTTSAQFKDGFRNDYQSNRAPAELQNIERVEVLKGPSSATFGRLDPSGTINMLTKRPLEDQQVTLGYMTGNWRLRRPTLDATGSLNRSKTLLYRLNFAYEQGDSFRDFLHRDKTFVAPSLSWRLGDHHFFRLDGEYLGGSSFVDRGLLAIGDRPANLPVSRFLGDPAISYPYEQGKAGGAYTGILNPHWTVNSAFRASWAQANYDGRQPNRLRPDNRTLELTTNFSNQWLTTQYWNNDIVGKVSTGKIEHTILGGIDLNRETFDSVSRAGARVTLDIYQPRYDLWAPVSAGDLPLSASSFTRNLFGGGFVQDQIRLRSNLKVLAGVRWDIAQLESLNRAQTSRTNARNTAWTPRLGIVYNPIPVMSVFANYSKSFNPQSGVTFTGDTFSPERGTQYEAGVKFDMLRSRIISSASVFQVEKTNVLTRDPLNEGFSIQVGAQRARGFEYDLTSQITRGWTVVAGYAYNKPVITADNTYRVGNYLLSAPRNSGSVWTTYELQGGFARGLGLGAGVFAVGQRWGDLENSFIVPGYARVDGSVFYKFYQREKVRWRLSVNINNIGDRTYYDGVRGRLGIVPGPARFVTASLHITL